jgi:hypothetical protein
MIEPFDCGMALVAEQTHGTLFPAEIVATLLALHVLTIFWQVLEDLRRPSEVAHVVGVDTAL